MVLKQKTITRSSPIRGIDQFFLKKRRRSDELVAGSPDGSLGTVIDPKLIEDMDYVALHGMGAYGQKFGNGWIGGPFGHQTKDLDFPPRQRRLAHRWFRFWRGTLSRFCRWGAGPGRWNRSGGPAGGLASFGWIDFDGDGEGRTAVPIKNRIDGHFRRWARKIPGKDRARSFPAAAQRQRPNRWDTRTPHNCFSVKGVTRR